MLNIENTRKTLPSDATTVFYNIAGLNKPVTHLPYSLRILLECLLRNFDGKNIEEKHIEALLNWKPGEQTMSVPFYPGRIIMQDFSGLPVLNDMAALRHAVQQMGGDPALVNPVIPVDVVIDHSVRIDCHLEKDAWQKNHQLEMERNLERFKFLKWGQNAFENLNVLPPATGIIHQLNLEYLASGVLKKAENDLSVVFPDTVLGTDSHTTMINGLGILGWGVGGIEATAAMLGQPIEIPVPDVIGVRLHGEIQEGVTPTDLTLSITQKLREIGVVGKFIEFSGKGLAAISAADRCMIANMTPESGATATYFPVDEETLNYFRLTGRDENLVDLMGEYYRSNQLFHDSEAATPQYARVLDLDLATIEPCVAGPRKPQERIPLRSLKSTFHKSLTDKKTEGGFSLEYPTVCNSADFEYDGNEYTLNHGSVLIAAITSCTNTSNPYVMIAAGLVAKNAVEHGLTIAPYIKTSLAPGSRVVAAYLEKAGLLEPLAQLGFNLAGFGCTTCIGNTGSLPESVVNAVTQNDIVAASVLSGNRNFEGRISPHTLANYLAAPPMVVVYALAGRMDIDLYSEPVGFGNGGKPVFLKQLFPSKEEIAACMQENIQPELFKTQYANVFERYPAWNSLQSSSELIFEWDDTSTYLTEPPFFEGLINGRKKSPAVTDARVLALLGDTITTDHISPASAISADSTAGRYLIEKGADKNDLNSFGTRRGNDDVMLRGTLANPRLQNQLVPGKNGGYTLHFPEKEETTIFDASLKYQSEGTPLVILAGKDYGTGSSRDWAAKGTSLLGVEVVIAQSFERIHRSNLIGMGVLPLQFVDGQSVQSLGLTGNETFTIEGLDQIQNPNEMVTVKVNGGKIDSFETKCRLDTPLEVRYYQDDGILNTIVLEILDAK